MIHIVGDAYSIQGEEQFPSSPKEQAQDITLQAVGSIPDRLRDIRQRIAEISIRKEESLRRTTASELAALSGMQEGEEEPTLFSLSLFIPDSLLKLDERVTALEEKLLPNELFRQKLQKKGNVIARIKLLHKQMVKLQEKKSQEAMISHIMQFCGHLEEKQEQMKTLYVYEAYMKTQALMEEIEWVGKYLEGLTQVEQKVKGVMSIEKITENHNAILKKVEEMSEKMEKMFNKISKEYSKIMQEIDNLE